MIDRNGPGALALAALLSGMLMPISASGAGFGRAGSLVPSGTIEFDRVARDQGSPTLTAQLAPKLQYFLLDDIALGIALSYGSHSQGEQGSTTIGAMGSCGYNIQVDERLSVFPQFGLAVEHRAGTDDITKTRFFFQADAPLLYHLAHFFIGIGPSLQMDLTTTVQLANGPKTDADKLLALGLRSVVGGWF